MSYSIQNTSFFKNSKINSVNTPTDEMNKTRLIRKNNNINNPTDRGNE